VSLRLLPSRRSPLIYSNSVILSCLTTLLITLLLSTYTEIFGHSGIRADWSLPITGPILSLIGCELIIEDHDLHHRFGRSGKNYGKQTRFWDVLYGTTGVRQEMSGLKGHRVE
jgi:sterol desaturase/sphingolipid hydroxylase (fatty acid hydroxylase superfamily)